jgi:hypothetical protein
MAGGTPHDGGDALENKEPEIKITEVTAPKSSEPTPAKLTEPKTSTPNQDLAEMAELPAQPSPEEISSVSRKPAARSRARKPKTPPEPLERLP